MVRKFEIKPEGPYSFSASIRFLEGFAPAAYDGGGVDHLRFAFVADGGEDVAGVMVRSEGDTVIGDLYGEADPEVVKRQVARILSLDVDGGGFAEVGERDPILDEPPVIEVLEQMADRWRPYRIWMSLHLRAMLEGETGEIFDRRYADSVIRGA